MGGGILNPPKCLNYAYLSLLIISCGIVRNTKQNHRLLLSLQVNIILLLVTKRIVTSSDDKQVFL